jgi:hypothetical protein
VLTNSESLGGVTAVFSRLWVEANTPGQSDSDQDGISDWVDNCPSYYNPDQADSDGDMVGNPCDNCPAVYNPDQSDENNDGVGDICDGYLHILTRTLPDAYLNEPYYARLEVMGGLEPYCWGLFGGDIPYGCVFTGDTIGAISGTPTYKSTYYFTVTCHDAATPVHWDTMSLALTVTDPPYLCGDCTDDEVVNTADVVCLIQFIFSGGAAPDPIVSCDVNCNGLINITDVIYLIQYIFSGGPELCESCR